jgi:polar amino acid transport system permease protein
MDYDVNFAVIWRNFDLLLHGLGLGLLLAGLALLAGSAIGMAGAFMSISHRRWVRAAAAAYVTVVRNLPLLVIILFAFFALPQTGIRLDKYETFIASLAIYAGAYLTEVFRSGLVAIPKGVVEAGMAIGLTRAQLNAYVILPLMLRNALPALGSNFISLFKDTSLAAAIAVPELTFQARKINVETFRVIEVWLTASVLYIASCYLIALALRRIEARFKSV